MTASLLVCPSHSSRTGPKGGVRRSHIVGDFVDRGPCRGGGVGATARGLSRAQPHVLPGLPACQGSGVASDRNPTPSHFTQKEGARAQGTLGRMERQILKGVEGGLTSGQLDVGLGSGQDFPSLTLFPSAPLSPSAFGSPSVELQGTGRRTGLSPYRNHTHCSSKTVLQLYFWPPL